MPKQMVGEVSSQFLLEWDRRGSYHTHAPWTALARAWAGEPGLVAKEVMPNVAVNCSVGGGQVTRSRDRGGGYVGATLLVLAWHTKRRWPR